VASKLILERDSSVSFSFSLKAIEIEHQKLATLSFLNFLFAKRLYFHNEK
jgi:hypothetical protein